MCEGDRLIADFAAGAEARPDVPEELAPYLTTTVSGLCVVWAYKLARPMGDLFVPLTGGAGYPVDARAECRSRRRLRGHDAPDPGCTCGFHALSSRRLPRLPIMHFEGIAALTVALSGRVLAFEWPGGGVLWRAERQTVVRVDRSAGLDWTVRDTDERFFGQRISVQRRNPGDPDGRPAVVRPAAPRDSGPIRLDLPVAAPVLPVCHDDAGWCAVSGTLEHQPMSADALSPAGCGR